MASQSVNYCKLIMVTGENNNKYYEMIHDGVSSMFTVNYGRVELTKTTISKPFSEWTSLKNSKIRKGYKDVTDLVSVKEKVEDKTDKEVLIKEEGDKVEEFINLMKKYTQGLINNTYTVKPKDVTLEQVKQAQGIIDKLNACIKSDKINETEVNTLLLELYMTIPRKMSNVKSYLLPNIKLEGFLDKEQDNLDAMASQVKKPSVVKKTKEKEEKKQSLLDSLGIKMKKLGKSEYEKDLGYLLKQSYSAKVDTVFQITKTKEEEDFQKWLNSKTSKQTKILIHGTKCTSVLSILEQGLKIRPVGNFQFSGKAYGNGNYFSEVMTKSLNYTGYGTSDKVLLVYEVHTGNPFVYEGWYKGNSFTLCLEELSKRGYDSTYVKAGNGLLNSEIIAYSEQQCKLKYIIWLK